MRPLTKLLIAIALFLVGCTPGEAAIQTAIARTEEAKPTNTLTATFTKIPTNTPTSTPDYCPWDEWASWLLEMQAIFEEVRIDLEAIQSSTLSGEAYTETVWRVQERHFLRVNRVDRLDAPICVQIAQSALAHYVDSFFEVISAAKEMDEDRMETSIQEFMNARATFLEKWSESEHPDD